MPQYKTGFVVSDIAQIHRLFDQRLAQLSGLQRIGSKRSRALAQAQYRQMLRVYSAFNRELDALAVAASKDATAKIRARIKATAKRPDTGHGGLHMRQAVRSRPILRGIGIATGAVGVAEIEALDKVVNPVTPEAGPFWRAQEEGTDAHLGRVIRGYFFGRGYSGDPTPPLGSYSGSGRQPLFVSARAGAAAFGAVGFQGGAGVRGGRGGYGTISHPIQARHFIRDGAHEAYADWLAGLRQIEARTAARLLPLL